MNPNHASIHRWLIGVLAAATVLLSGGALSAQTVKVNPIPGLDPSFIRGADVSTLLAVEKAGGKFTDENGKPGDALAILKDHGVNWIRVRLWNDPTNADDVISGGKDISKKGDPVGGGNNDLSTAITLAKRAKALGLKVLLDFHYSDFWTDPSHQVIPKAWQGLDLEGLEKALYAFTKQTLKAMADAGAQPEMVQLGNETNGGMLWPVGKTWQATKDEAVGGYDAFAALLSSGARAVRELDPSILVAVHLANGGDKGLYQSMFDELTKRSLDYDVIGFSFYPYWHGTVSQLAENLKTVSARYHKPVVVMETAYARAFEEGQGNVFGPGMDKAGGYRATAQGQASAFRDVAAAVADVPGRQGLGLFYWEPAWLPVKGVGWRTGEGNNWSNQTFFDAHGRAVSSLSVFKLLSTDGPAIDAVPVEGLPVALTLSLDQKEWALPDQVSAVFSDDSYRPAPVTWTTLDRSRISSPQVLTVKGVLTGTKVSVSAVVSVVPHMNLLSDPGFESGTLGDWKVEGDPVVQVEKNPGNAHTGDWSLKYWKDKDFAFILRRLVEGVKDGTYTAKVWSMGGGGEKAIRFSARYADGSPGPAVKLVNTGWQKWNQYTLTNLQIRGGRVELTITVDARDNNWGNFDDIELEREGDLKP